MDESYISAQTLRWRQKLGLCFEGSDGIRRLRIGQEQRPSTANTESNLWQVAFTDQKYALGISTSPEDLSRASSKHSQTRFSSLGDALEDLRLSTRKAVMSSPKRALSIFNRRSPESPARSNNRSNPVATCRELDQPSAASRWLRRATSSNFRRTWLSPTEAMLSPQRSIGQEFRASPPVPGTQIEPPKVPYNLASGAAARASAAASNELLGSARTIASLHSESRLAEPEVAKDSESGVGIDLRDRSEDKTDISVPMIRKDPFCALPKELMDHIVSYLDAASLISAEQVSRGWNSSASSQIIWKDVFRKEYSPCQVRSGKLPLSCINKVPGLGKSRPDQNWKKMWQARKALDQRWINNHAAAIYLEGHKDSVYCVQFDEHKILTGSRDRTVRIWDAHTYKCLKVLGVPKTNASVTVADPVMTLTDKPKKPFITLIPRKSEVEAEPIEFPSLYHSGSILCLQFDADIMVTGSSDNTCIIWDIKADYKPIHRLRKHTAGVLDVCFDGDHIVSCSKDTTICLWDRRTGSHLRTLSGHRGPVNAVQLRSDLIVSASGDGVAKLWNITSGLCIKEFPSRDRGMACVEFSQDCRTILAGGNDQIIYQFDANTGDLVRELNGHKGLVRSLHLDGPNDRLISGSYDTSVKVFDLRTGEKIVDFPGWTTSWMLSAKADYRRIVATGQDGHVVIMDFGFMLEGVELLQG